MFGQMGGAIYKEPEDGGNDVLGKQSYDCMPILDAS